MDRVESLRADFEALGVAMRSCEPAALAGIVRERRMISELLEQLERPEGASVVDQLAARRAAGTPSVTGTASRRG